MRLGGDSPALSVPSLGRRVVEEADLLREAASEALSSARREAAARVLSEVEGAYRRGLSSALSTLRGIVRRVPESDDLGDLGRRARAALALLARWEAGFALDRIALRSPDHGEDPEAARRRADEAVREDSSSIVYTLSALALSDDLPGEVRRWAISARYAVEDATLLAARVYSAADGHDD